MRFHDITGQKFNRLTAMWPAGKSKCGVVWLCLCDCGKMVPIPAARMKNGTTMSCGCARVEGYAKLSKSKTRHGHAKTKTGVKSAEYLAWERMQGRCRQPASKDYKYYGGRGIRVCDRWLGEHGFENFLADMGPKPKGLTLDRWPDVNGNYEPSNCRWATWKEQQNNKTDNHNITHEGKTMTLTQWAESSGLTYTQLHGRLDLGWSMEEALNTPIRSLKRRKGNQGISQC
jgi:hypothetical protein